MQVKLRNNLRAWLGLDTLATSDMLNAAELRHRQRHAEMMGMLNRIEQRLINAHVGAHVNRSAALPTPDDWDGVLQNELAKLLREQEAKEQ